MRNVDPNGMKPSDAAMPFTKAPMACSRTPKCTLRPSKCPFERAGELLPAFVLFLAILGARLEECAHLVGNEERRLERPTDVLFGGFDFGGAERLAVCFGGVVLVG